MKNKRKIIIINKIARRENDKGLKRNSSELAAIQWKG